MHTQSSVGSLNSYFIQINIEVELHKLLYPEHNLTCQVKMEFEPVGKGKIKGPNTAQLVNVPVTAR